MARGYVPGGVAEAAQLLRGKLSTAIQHYSYNGNEGYSLVGSMPISLTHEKRNTYSSVRVSNTWPTLAEAIQAVIDAGITRFQLPDCTWYQG